MIDFSLMSDWCTKSSNKFINTAWFFCVNWFHRWYFVKNKKKTNEYEIVNSIFVCSMLEMTCEKYSCLHMRWIVALVEPKDKKGGGFTSQLSNSNKLISKRTYVAESWLNYAAHSTNWKKSTAIHSTLYFHWIKKLFQVSSRDHIIEIIFSFLLFENGHESQMVSRPCYQRKMRPKIHTSIIQFMAGTVILEESSHDNSVISSVRSDDVYWK